MITTADAHSDSVEGFTVILRKANSLWRRAGVRTADRKALLAELETELNGAHQDGHGVDSVLGEDSDQMLRSWAIERGMCGRALRLALVIPSAFIGIVTGMSVVLLVLLAGFSDWSTAFDPGPFVLPFYASGGLLGYLCALLCVWGVLRCFGDPNALSTVRWLSVLLPIGGVLCTGAGVAVAWSRGFNTSVPVFVTVVGVVVVGLGLTIGLARYLGVNGRNDSETETGRDVVGNDVG
ncbi:hypothetical protein ERC79_17930 [Rhodococcus sp. ABRD24]|uniref:hypothetical protein n=1 Tax=Rhodococcus sp. ABRD24 TaxID=2507582 RepID=UPI00103A6E74|nr:hypothetical protein [Rhodococcus sp. ABRD24]QBJ97608.1 hypothetical protein ERC79_17930 [Rhodococcus sp. ABRD24]